MTRTELNRAIADMHCLGHHLSEPGDLKYWSRVLSLLERDRDRMEAMLASLSRQARAVRAANVEVKP